MNIHAKRLLNVARALRESPQPAAFTMGDYCYGRHDDYPCGTPACAVGHYAARRDLQGLFRLSSGTLQILKDRRTYVWVNFCDEVDEKAERHFGINSDEWTELFSYAGCDNAQTPEEAAAFIERFVARKWPEALKPKETVPLAEPVVEGVPEEVCV